MAVVRPASPSFEQEFLVLRDTYQTFRLRIPRRLIGSDVIVNFSVYLSEEAPEDPSSTSPASASVQDSDILLGDMNGLVYRAHRFEEAPAQDALVQQAPAQEVSGLAASVQEVLPPPNSTMEREFFNPHAQPASPSKPA